MAITVENQMTKLAKNMGLGCTTVTSVISNYSRHTHKVDEQNGLKVKGVGLV